VFGVALAFAPLIISAAPLEGRLSLGYTDTSGNTEEENINFDFKLKERKSERLNLLYDGLVNYGKSSGQVNSDKKRLGVIGEFVQDKKNSYYVQSGVLKDRFAGYETRLNLGAGAYKTLIARKDQNLKAAAGLEITKEDYTDSTSSTKKWVKLGLIGDRIVRENIKVYSSIDFGGPSKSFENRYQIDFGIGTIFTVNDRFDLESKYLANYRKTPLVTGKEKTDSTFITNLVYKM
jgi:putative salt-induced outer membrane protein YdiY